MRYLVSILFLAASASVQIISGNHRALSGCGSVPSPVLKLRMDDASGTTATDTSGNSNNFTITAGSGGWTTLGGVTNGVYQFDGSATKMVGATATNVNFDYNQSFSIFAVVEPLSGGGTTRPIFTHTTTNHRGYDITLEDSGGGAYGLAFLLSNTYPTAIDMHCFSCPTINDGVLHDFLVTYDGSGVAAGVKFYQDGVDESAFPTVIHDALASNSTTTSTVPNVGFRPEDSQFFKGYIGPIYIWNSVLTAGNATTLHCNFYAP